MSDDPQIFIYDAPTGRRIDQPGRSRTVFTINSAPAFTPELGGLLRRNLREIDSDDLEQRGRRVWVDTTSGEELERVRTLVDPVAPRESGAAAFSVLGGQVHFFKLRGTRKAESISFGDAPSARVAS